MRGRGSERERASLSVSRDEQNSMTRRTFADHSPRASCSCRLSSLVRLLSSLSLLLRCRCADAGQSTVNGKRIIGWLCHSNYCCCCFCSSLLLLLLIFVTDNICQNYIACASFSIRRAPLGAGVKALNCHSHTHTQRGEAVKHTHTHMDTCAH